MISVGSSFFGRLGPGISLNAQTPPKTSKSRFSRKTPVKPPQHRQSKKVAQRERGSYELKHSRKTARWRRVTAGRFFVGWVPDRQNRSPTDETAPSPPKNGHISGPRVTWDPKQGSLAPHLACNQIWSAGVSPGTAPKTGKSTFRPFGPFRPPGGRKITPSPPDPSQN